MEPLTATDPQQIGPYQLRARLGAGGMGVVYLGVSPTADRVAVKVVRQDAHDWRHARERFDGEIAVLRRVHGARVARFETAGLDGDIPWLAVEFVPGHSLRDHVERNGPLPGYLTAMLGALLAEGLQRIHNEGLLHRDLKPQNVLLGPDGPKVIDFGLAVFRDRDRELTQSGMIVGTYAYMAPEQASGCGELTPTADVFALGATLFFAATAQRIYGNVPAARHLRLLDDPNVQPDLVALPPELRPIVGSMLEYNPQVRPGLDTVANSLLMLATTQGRTAREIRREFTQRTRADRVEFALPDEDPLEEPDDVTASDSGEAPTSATADILRVDLGWLADKVRTTYDRDPRL